MLYKAHTHAPCIRTHARCHARTFQINNPNYLYMCLRT